MAKKSLPTTSPAESFEDGSEKDHEAYYAYRTLLDAEGHRANPALMKRVSAVAERHIGMGKQVMKSVADIKAYSKKKYQTKKMFEEKE